MEEAYRFFSQIYNDFMEDIPYRKWADTVSGILKEAGIEDGLVAELGCGTGIFTRLLKDRGYDMIGIDASADMLEEARFSDESGDILYLQQDMRSFELYGTVRAIVSIFDSINYITEPRELVQVFRLVNNYLDPGGLFVFDFNTKDRYEESAKDGVLADNAKDYSYIWDGCYDPVTCLNEIELTLFLRRDENRYERFSESHVQRGYSLSEMIRLVTEGGLSFERAIDADTGELLWEAQPKMLSKEGAYPEEKEKKERRPGRIYIVAAEQGKRT